MARIRDYATTVYAAATTANMVMDMPIHVAGDLLLAFVGKDAASAFTTPSTAVGTPVSSSNWTLIRSGTSTGAGGGIYALRATSASENVTFPLTIDTCVGTIISIKEVYGSTVADAVSSSVAYGTEDATLPFAGVGITTSVANALLFSHRFADTTVGTSYLPPWVNIFTGDAANGGSTVAYSFEPTVSTAVAAPSMWSGGEDDGKAAMCEVRDLYQDLGVFTNIAITLNNTITKSSGTSFITSGVRVGETITIETAEDSGNNGLWTVATVAADVITVTSATLVNNADDDTMRIYAGSNGGSIMSYIPLDVVPSVLISPLTGSATTSIERGAYVAAASIVITSVAGKTVTGVTVASTADAGFNPFRGSMLTAGASSTTGLAHTEFNLTSTQDVTTGDLIFGTFMHTGPRDYLDSGNVSRGGKYILLGSTTANWRAWVVGGQFSKTDSPNVRVNFLIEPSYTTTQYSSAGTANYASLDYLAFGSSGYFGAPSIRWNELWELRTAVLAGGSATAPFNFDDLVFTVNGGCGNIPVLQQSGSSAVVWIPLQFGGNEKIGVGINLNVFQWSRQASTTLGYVDCHVSDEALGVEFYGTGANDYIHITNSVFTRDTPYYWRFNASHSASADIDFTGTSVIGANVTLRSTVTLDRVVFIDCGTFTQNAATITNSTFSNTVVTSASPTDMDNISDSSFTSDGTGHAIVVGSAIAVPGSPLSITFSGNTFTSFASTDGSTGNEAIHILYTSGTLTINIAGGGSIPSIRTGGATVVVQNPVTVKVTVKDANTLVAIQDARVLMEADSVATGTHTGANNASTLTDGSQSFTIDALIGYRIYNTTDGSDGLITDNDATTVTAALAGGTQNDWDTSDAYIIVAKPALNPVSIASATTTATVTHRNHGLINSSSVVIRGATEDEYNGIFTISNVTTDTYQYTMSADPVGILATGSPTATAVILSDVTGDGTPDPVGILQTTSFNYIIDQPITGKVRRATTGDLYKTGAITGTITSNGLDTTVLLIVDE